jgi:hypothetical protein
LLRGMAHNIKLIPKIRRREKKAIASCMICAILAMRYGVAEPSAVGRT